MCLTIQPSQTQTKPRKRFRLKRTIAQWLLSGILLIGMAPGAIAQESNYGTIQLNPKNKSAVVDGSLGGSTSLAAITANVDRNENQCFGFGAPKPDYILELRKPLKQLTISLNSGGKDTTIVIEAPDGSFICADDFGNSKDAGIDEPDWSSGKYKIWIGLVAPSRGNYRLTLQGS